MLNYEVVSPADNFISTFWKFFGAYRYAGRQSIIKLKSLVRRDSRVKLCPVRLIDMKANMMEMNQTLSFASFHLRVVLCCEVRQTVRVHSSARRSNPLILSLSLESSQNMRLAMATQPEENLKHLHAELARDLKVKLRKSSASRALERPANYTRHSRRAITFQFLYELSNE